MFKVWPSLYCQPSLKGLNLLMEGLFAEISLNISLCRRSLGLNLSDLLETINVLSLPAFV